MRILHLFVWNSQSGYLFALAETEDEAREIMRKHPDYGVGIEESDLEKNPEIYSVPVVIGVYDAGWMSVYPKAERD